jgi:hypothetical protein
MRGSKNRAVQGQVPSGERALRGETSHKHAQCSKAQDTSIRNMSSHITS